MYQYSDKCSFFYSTDQKAGQFNGNARFTAERVFILFIVSPYFALWQEIVLPDVQGRVFSIREMVQIASQPIGYLLGGLMADRLFEPAMHSNGWFSMLVGTGPGAGMASMFLFTSVCGGLLGLIGLLLPSIRQLDEPGSSSTQAVASIIPQPE